MVGGYLRMRLAGGVALVMSLSACAGLGSGGSMSEAAAQMVRMGDYAYAQGDRVTAASLYEQALSVDPDASEALVRLGRIQESLGASVSAIDTYQRAVDRSPNDPEALRRLGNALIAQTYPERAMAFLQRSLEIDDSPKARNSLGVALDLVGQHRLAQEQYRAGMGHAPADLDLRNNLALSLALDGDYPGAIALGNEVTRDGSANSRHRQTFALVLGLAGRMDEAQAVAGMDLSPSLVAANLDYYDLLRSIEPSAARALAITGGMGAPSAAAAQVGFAFQDPRSDDPDAVMIAAVPR